MTREEVRTIVAGIIGDNNAIKMPPHPNGIQLEWNPKDWMKVEDVLNSIRKRLVGSGYELCENKKHAMIVPAPKTEPVVTNQQGKNAKRR